MAATGAPAAALPQAPRAAPPPHAARFSLLQSRYSHEGSNMKRDAIQILLVEDSLSDAELTTEALRSARVLNAVHRVCDGVEALAHLRDPALPRPDLILLDLNLPRMSGYEFLEIAKGDAELSDIPVVVLTTSQAERDILLSYRMHANCYVSKPVDLQAFLDVVQQTGNFWLEIVKLPAA
jgi:two-component system, chemotaxis family, response regulator Rcp1